ncbi:MAG: zinc dependent phospholipase C family protein [Clostridia bacterium]|nr:zinc dependent phospholipase C family protein [Clostridia bacterium]
MLSITHKLIAQKVYDVLNSELGIKIDLEGLKHGSVAPDIYPSMLLMSHCMDGSIDLVHEAMDSILKETVPEKGKELEKFSVKLGIIVHFVSDYFCKAHNEKRYSNLLLHYVYERKLKVFFKRKIEACMPLVRLLKSEDWKTSGDIKSMLKDWNDEYNSLERSMMNDVIYSAGVSMIIALNIVSRCMENIGEERIRKIA